MRARSLPEAMAADGVYRAGGTDLQALRRLRGCREPVVDLTGVPGLAGIRAEPEGFRIGASTRISDLATDPGVMAGYPALAAAAGSLATPQIRAVATVGGNLLQRNRCPYFRHPDFTCHKTGHDSCPARAGHHAHGVVFDLGPCVAPHPSTLAMALLAHEAHVLTSSDDRLTIPDLLGDGSDGRRDHRLADGAILTAIHLPPPVEEQGGYSRATGRVLAEWPAAEAVVRLQTDAGRIEQAVVAVGGVAPIPLLLPEVGRALEGVATDDRQSILGAAQLAVAGANPLPQTRYKLDLLVGTVADAVDSALSGAGTVEVAVGERGLPAPEARL